MLLKTIIKHRQLILVMAKRELQSQYVGSFLGFLWTFIQPAVMIVVFWFVFSIGFKAKPMNDVPFVVWLTAGMAPWFFFAAIVVSSTGAVIHQAHLIKKTVFPVQILPVVKIFSSMVGHGAFVILLMTLIFFNRMGINTFYFQVLYYLFCLCCLSLGIGYFVSALNVFIRDVGQIVGVLIQVGFWATPIFWDILIMPEKIQQILKLNPVYYIVQGYRDSFIYFTPFWERPLYGLYFWVVTCLMWFIGTYVFQKLKPQFADVL
ncbi:MAG: ABC transporter permease [Desulfobacterales bacterium]|nr:ABC transporter permease [Desulfobacterales bacterium]